MSRADSAELRLRRGLLSVALITEVGALVELGMHRHWKNFEQIIPWVAIGALLILTSFALARPTGTTLALRTAAVLAVPVTLFGIWEHVGANHNAGPLDLRYATKWATMSSWSQWWTAATKGVGPTPPLTPALIGLIGLMLAVATVGLRRMRGRAPRP